MYLHGNPLGSVNPHTAKLHSALDQPTQTTSVLVQLVVGFTHNTSMASHQRLEVDTKVKPTYSLSERVTAVH